jgi:hypothetical protein
MQSLISAAPAVPAVSNDEERILCPIVVLRNADTEVLVSGLARPFRLPAVQIPAVQRVAPNLLAQIAERFGLRAVGRFSLVTDEPRKATVCVVVDALDCCAPDPAGCFWLSLTALRWDDFAPDAQEALWSVLARIHAYASGTLAARFVAAGWLQEVRAWTGKSLAGSGLRLGALCSQYNLGPDFALLRFATSGPAVWFKAVGSRCAREFPITRILADSRIPHTARMLAAREDWRAWLSVEAAGRHPDVHTSGAHWEIAARCLSELQIASIPYTRALLAAGSCDLRAVHLDRAIEPSLIRLSALMKLQPMVPPVRLGPAEFLTIKTKLRQACLRLETLQIPDTAGHSDLSAGNVLIGENDAVFLDWAECHVGPPFITLAYLELLAGAAGCRMRMREAYLERWRQEWSAKQVDALLALAPLLAVFACVLVCDNPLQAPAELDSGKARRLRSLARRMHVEAFALRSSGPH